MRHATILLSGCAALILAGCTDTYHVGTQIGGTAAMLTSADLRVITDRPNPHGNPARAVCTEPPPDVAKTLQTALQLAAKATLPNSVGGEGSLNSQTAEQLAELAGRVPGVIGLRDGTYRLCEAWSNGAVGDSAYSLALGRYGELLVTLILGDAVTAATRPAPVSLTASLTPNQTGNGTDSAGKDSTGSTPGAASPGGGKTAQAAASPDTASIQLATLTLQPLHAAAAAPGGAPAAHPAAAPGPAPAPAGANPAKSPAPAPSAGTDNNAASAQALLQMQENYMTLGPAGPLISACVTAGDHTAPNFAENSVLTVDLCQYLLRGFADAVKSMAGARLNASGKATVTPAAVKK